MAIRAMRISAETDQPSVVLIEGGPTDVRASLGQDFHDRIAGFEVTKVTEAQHDGHPAVNFTLADDFGKREIGRFVIRTDSLHEDPLTWERWYDEIDDAFNAVERFKNPPATPKVIRARVDMAYEGETLEEAMAAVSAAHGVSIRVVNENGPGGGWPEVVVFGFAENVRKALTATENGWGYTEEDAYTVIL